MNAPYHLWGPIIFKTWCSARPPLLLNDSLQKNFVIQESSASDYLTLLPRITCWITRRITQYITFPSCPIPQGPFPLDYTADYTADYVATVPRNTLPLFRGFHCVLRGGLRGVLLDIIRRITLISFDVLHWTLLLYFTGDPWPTTFQHAFWRQQSATMLFVRQ